jgi:hypothetical protein
MFTTKNNYLINLYRPKGPCRLSGDKSNNNIDIELNNINDKSNNNIDESNNNLDIESNNNIDIESNNNIDESNIFLDKWISQMRYNDWNSRQLKIEYEIKQRLNEFNEFRKLNNIYN